MPSYEVIPNIVLTGTDVSPPTPIGTVSECREACNRNPTCTAFSFGSGLCQLKSSIGGMDVNTDSTTYIKRGDRFSVPLWLILVVLVVLGYVIFKDSL